MKVTIRNSSCRNKLRATIFNVVTAKNRMAYLSSNLQARADAVLVPIMRIPSQL